MNTKVNKVRTLSDVCWLSFHEYYNHYDYDKLFAPQIQQLTKCVPQLCFRKRGPHPSSAISSLRVSSRAKSKPMRGVPEKKAKMGLGQNLLGGSSHLVSEL